MGNKAAEVIERKDGEALLVRAIGAPRMQTFIRASATHAITLTVKSSDFASYQELFQHVGHSLR